MNLELEEIQRRIEDEPHGHVPSDSKSEDEQWFLGFNEKGGDVFLKDRVVVEDTGDRHIFLKLAFTPCKAEQPLQGMELQEKEAQKDLNTQEICLERT